MATRRFPFFRAVPITGLLLAAGVGGAAPPLEQSAPTTTEPSPAPKADADKKPPATRRRMKIDVEKQVERVLAEEEKAAPPRFETTVDVEGKSPQVAVERSLHGTDLDCARTPGGPPNEVDMRAVRRTPPTSVDFAALAGFLSKKVKGKGPNRYFVYRQRRADGMTTYALRETRVSEAAFYNTEGVTFELVEAFPDRESATRLWRRLERGQSASAPSPTATPPPPWALTTCPAAKK